MVAMGNPLKVSLQTIQSKYADCSSKSPGIRNPLLDYYRQFTNVPETPTENVNTEPI
jgi:hypothetical protein